MSVNGVISRVTVSATGSYVGGLIGNTSGSDPSNSTITNSSATGSVSGDSNVGGLIGILGYSTLGQSYATGDVYATGDGAGGLVGSTAGEDGAVSHIADSYARGEVTSEYQNAGGLAGVIGSVLIENSYATGDVTAPVYTGGFVGAALSSSGHSTILHSFSTGHAVGVDGAENSDSGYINGFAGLFNDPGEVNVTDIHFNNDNQANCGVLWGYSVVDTNECVGVSIADNPTVFQISTDAPVNAWDLDAVWRVMPNNYPCLRAFTACSTDTDNDGIANTIENGAPNDGDANGDGVQDAGQGNVTSWVNPLTNAYAVLEVSDCENTGVSADASILSSVISAMANDHKDPAYKYPAGVMGFTFHCGLACYPCSQIAALGEVHSLCCPAPSSGDATGTAATVTQYFYGNYDATTFVARKYNPNTHAYTTIPGAVASNITIGGQNALKVVYQIEDNGPLDQDPEVGTITDPSGPAVLAVAAPNTGFGGTHR